MENHQFFFLSYSSSCSVSSSLSEVLLVLRFWRSALWLTSYPALGLGFPSIGLLGAYFFALCPFSGVRSEVHQLVLCCQHVMLICWVFSILQCCLTLEVAQWLRTWAFMNCYLPISGSGLSPTQFWPFCLSSLYLLKAPMEISHLPLLPFLVYSEHPSPLLHVPFQFLVYYSRFFLWGRGQSV
jgi:hypothetical protein